MCFYECALDYPRLLRKKIKAICRGASFYVYVPAHFAAQVKYFQYSQSSGGWVNMCIYVLSLISRGQSIQLRTPLSPPGDDHYWQWLLTHLSLDKKGHPADKMRYKKRQKGVNDRQEVEGMGYTPLPLGGSRLENLFSGRCFCAMLKNNNSIRGDCVGEGVIYCFA